MTQDQSSHISEEASTSELLRRSGLPRKDQHQVVSHAGVTLKSEAVEAVLKTMYGRHHDGQKVGRRLEAGAASPWSSASAVLRMVLELSWPGGRFQPSSRGQAVRHPSNPRPTYLQGGAEYQDGQDFGSEHEEQDFASTTASDDVPTDQLHLEHEAGFDQDDVEDAQWPAVPEDEEEASEDDVPHEQVHEAFIQGWKARAKVAPKKNRRRFLLPDQRPGAATPGQRGRRSPPDTRNRGSPPPAASRLPPASSTDTNARKKQSSCRRCGQLGHWTGDARCPHVIVGKVKPDQPNPRQAGTTNAVHHAAVVGSPQLATRHTRCSQSRPTGWRLVSQLPKVVFRGGVPEAHSRPTRERQRPREQYNALSRTSAIPDWPSWFLRRGRKSRVPHRWCCRASCLLSPPALRRRQRKERMFLRLRPRHAKVRHRQSWWQSSKKRVMMEIPTKTINDGERDVRVGVPEQERLQDPFPPAVPAESDVQVEDLIAVKEHIRYLDGNSHHIRMGAYQK
ncbi:hypothetical protein N9L68_00775 [bacterium]|nr:hypothetical protein [bacterium]